MRLKIEGANLNEIPKVLSIQMQGSEFPLIVETEVLDFSGRVLGRRRIGF